MILHGSTTKPEVALVAVETNINQVAIIEFVLVKQILNINSEKKQNKSLKMMIFIKAKGIIQIQSDPTETFLSRQKVLKVAKGVS